jgi:glycosyltransferase involved in cell wall biosynthesis
VTEIVFINQWTGYLTKDIINAFAEKYDKIDLIAGTISKSGNPLNERIRIKKISRYNKKNIFTRLFSWIFATIQVIYFVNIKYRKCHLFITSNPPTLAFITLFCPNRYSVHMLDIYPDGLVTTGIISKNSLINKLWEKRNIKFLTKAQNIFTLTDGMAKSLTKYCDSEKIKVISQWPSSSENIQIARSENKFIQAHSLEDYFIVMYSGNIGFGHHVDVLIEAARKLQCNSDILFMIIGEGIYRHKVEKLVKKYDLRNCRLLSYQPPEMFNYSLKAANIGVVSVSKKAALLSVPSKTYNLINNHLPLLCITVESSELAILVERYQIGKCFKENQVEEISDFILSLKNDNSLYLDYQNNLKKCATNFTSKNTYSYTDNFII